MLAGAMLLAPVQNADAFPLEGVQSKDYHDNGFVEAGKNVWQKMEECEEEAFLVYTCIDMDNDNKMSVGDIMVTLSQKEIDIDNSRRLTTSLKVERVDGKINNNSEDKLGRQKISTFGMGRDLQK
jgi:hypothetical protein